MSNKSKINQELVKAFNSVLLSDNTAITNLTIEKDHVVLSFDENMNIDQRRKYLREMRESIVEKFCGDEQGANDLFYTGSFPFNFNQGKWIKDSSRNRFSVPMKKKVVCNLKYLLANELIRFTIETIIDSHPDKDVEGNVSDKNFDKESYLYCICFNDQELKDSFVSLFSSAMESYENAPKNFKDFLEQQYFPKEEKTYVYLKEGVFDDLKFVKDIVKHRASLMCRCFDAPKGEVGVTDMLKLAAVNLFRKADIPVDRIVRDSYLNSDEDSILIPIVSYNNEEGYLTREEVKHVNNMFDMNILNSFEGHTSQKSLLGSKGVYGIDFANPDIAYCVIDKIIGSSVINEDYKLSIDPARVPAMKPQTLEEKVGTDGPTLDSGFGGSAKNLVIRAGNSRKFLRPDYYGEDKGGDDASNKDSGLGASSVRSSKDSGLGASSARSSKDSGLGASSARSSKDSGLGASSVRSSKDSGLGASSARSSKDSGLGASSVRSSKDSGLGASSARSSQDSGLNASSARSSLNDKPKPILDQSSVLQSAQCSTKKRTSFGKNTSCCIS